MGILNYFGWLCWGKVYIFNQLKLFNNTQKQTWYLFQYQQFWCAFYLMLKFYVQNNFFKNLVFVAVWKELELKESLAFFWKKNVVFDYNLFKKTCFLKETCLVTREVFLYRSFLSFLSIMLVIFLVGLCSLTFLNFYYASWEVKHS